MNLLKSPLRGTSTRRKRIGLPIVGDGFAVFDEDS